MDREARFLKGDFLCIGFYCFLLLRQDFTRLASILYICLTVRGLWKWFPLFTGVLCGVHSLVLSRFFLCSTLFLLFLRIIYIRGQGARGIFNLRLGAPSG